ncbi:hypothetical protein [Parasitella parasitica]|uniref:Survival Motor Neuron Gemin2-binding domain-containing protein n=1 Tax=Parasitella parasitica TaxID=35722 RepID=A0A0B7N2J3_9FUNG|nr:hypothetical protein [Parasitella parasitica]
MSKQGAVDQDKLTVGTVIFTAGDAQQNADYWDDSELIAHWDKTVEAYRKQCSDQADQAAANPPYHKRKEGYGLPGGISRPTNITCSKSASVTREGHVTKVRPAPRKKLVAPSRPAPRKDLKPKVGDQGSTPAIDPSHNTQQEGSIYGHSII